MANILIVEDDVDIAQGIAEFLDAEGHILDFAYNGRQALNLLAQQDYELVLLDINLPFVSGFDVCLSLLENQLAKFPVIIMSASGETRDILNGFKSGAWDYLVKPFSFAELAARINVNLAKSLAVIKHTLAFNDVELDENSMKFHFLDNDVQLHKVGFYIMKILICAAPDVVITQTLHQKLWGENTPDSDPLRSHIYKLRKQFEKEFNQSFITTIKGVGYRFDVK